ncbi:MAG: LysR family transcriptional regulator [Saccharospirillum sp.]
MDLRALKYFVATFESGSVSAAARQCFVAQPSVSAAIHQLEQELGVALFERHARGVRATLDGRKLYPMAAQLLANSAAIVHSFQHESRSQPLVLGLMRSLGAERMSEWLKGLMQAMPSLELTLVNPEEPCDARIVTRNLCQPHEQFEPIWSDRYQVAIPAEHPLSLSKTLNVQALDGQPFIVRKHCSLTRQLLSALDHHAIRVKIRAHLRTVEYSLALVAAGVGLSWVPDWPDYRQRTDMVLRPLRDMQPQQQLGLAYPAELNPAMRSAMVALCRQFFQMKAQQA